MDIKCAHCGKNLQKLRTIKKNAEEIDCESSFKKIHDYFSARVLRCKTCNVFYFQGYFEDFTDCEIWAEFGKRHWIEREISKDEFDQIMLHKEKQNLDINSFK